MDTFSGWGRQPSKLHMKTPHDIYKVFYNTVSINYELIVHQILYPFVSLLLIYMQNTTLPSLPLPSLVFSQVQTQLRVDNKV